MEYVSGVISILSTVSQILTAGIAIIAFALLLYSLTFNLRDKVAQAFATIMVCLVIVFSAEAFGGTSGEPGMIDFWLRLQWVGLIVLPPAYLHFSDSLLATTGLPSRWRRKWAVRLTYLFSAFLIVLLFTPYFLGDLVVTEAPTPHHQATIVTELFTIYYAVILVLAWINFIRAYNRTLTKTSKRRMLYLTISAVGPALGSFPFLLYGSDFAANQTMIFWLLAILVNLVLGLSIFISAYAVAFFGVPWPDRVVKSRLAKWTLRGPLTAILTLGIVTVVKRGGEAYGIPYSAFIPIVMVVTVLIMEYAITLFFPYLERWLVFGPDERDVDMLRSLESRIITRNDLRQFIEMILAAVTDRLQARGAFLLANGSEGLDVVDATEKTNLSPEDMAVLEQRLNDIPADDEMILIDSDMLIPLKYEKNGTSHEPLGYLGITGIEESLPLDAEQEDSLNRLTRRATLALRDRELLGQVFELLEKMDPQEELIQQLRAAGRFDRQGILKVDETHEKKAMVQYVKDALTHYWGGPKLTDSPLMNLEVVKRALGAHEGNAVNALRSVLKDAIEQTRPEGDRKYTGEWLLYNILDLKFMEGKKVREIAIRLSVSEADLYRKQRVAIEMISDIIVQMELSSGDMVKK